MNNYKSKPRASRYQFNDDMFKVEDDIKRVLKKACPQLNESSGIYFIIREELGVKYAYVGQAVNLMQRMVGHMQGSRQAIDHSLRKRGLYHEETNTVGWRINVMYVPVPLLDQKEQYYINLYSKAGYEMYNIEGGGKEGKYLLDEKKPPKTYQDGLKQGKLNLARELQHIIDLHLDIKIKEGKENNKISIGAFEKFNKLLNEAINGKEIENE